MTTETREPTQPTANAGLPIAPKPTPRRFHQASWDEPVILELSVPGSRGVLPPLADPAITALVGNPAADLPPGIGRARPPALPELSQVHVLRHYDRLSQETLGADLNIDVGQGTCTMKYSPKVNDQLIRSPKLADTHPAQDPSTVQGTLEILWRLEGMLAEISGMARVSLQPAAGSAAIWANIAMIRAWHESRGEGFDAPNGGRNEVITTIFSHPSNAAAAKVAGYKVITLYPDPDGYPDLDALRAAVSERTAALVITNPEDTGIFNPRIEAFVEAVHDAGGLCSYDQANANGILGITRARDAGFDVSHFNLHKTFSTPHACGGPGAGAIGVAPDLVPFLPTPTIERAADGTFRFDDDHPQSIGKVRPWHGITPNLVRAYAWIMALGAEGLREVAEIAVLNNNYLLMKVLEARGVSAPFAAGRRRIEQVRYSWERLHRETGVTTDDLAARVIDFGTHYWMSHHPYVVPEPMTLEPTESYSREDLDAYAAILAEVAREAYEDRDHLLAAPHASTIHRIDHAPLDDPSAWAITWRAYRRKHLGG